MPFSKFIYLKKNSVISSFQFATERGTPGTRPICILIQITLTHVRAIKKTVIYYYKNSINYFGRSTARGLTHL